MSIVLQGVAIGKGIAIGKAHLLQQGMDDVPHYSISDEEIANEIKRFDDAILKTRKQLEHLRISIPENAPAELGAFISLHLMLLTDVTISREPVDIVREKKINAEWALRIQTDKLSEQFEVIEDNYLRERKHDMLQVVERVFKNLRGFNDDFAVVTDLFDDTILIASDLDPADTIHFKDNRIAAFVTDLGGPTSHTAILGRSLDMPSVIALHHAREIIHEGEWLIVDGIDGVVILEPSATILEEYRERQKHYRAQKRELNKLKKTAAMTLDEVPIEILANIETSDDVTLATKYGADGVGLYRSEFLYLNRDAMPDEQEQYEAYCKIIKRSAGKVVTIRTVDLGADKNPRWFGESTALNPAMGMTGIRLCLAEPVMFRTQMRAILRAGLLGPVRMMWPMISSLAELQQCLSHLETTKEQLNANNIEFADNIEIGIMIEIPAAAIAINSLLKLVDFISIGTNDLIQFTLAVDRNDDAVSYLYQPYHPSVLRLVYEVINRAHKLNKPISICGEMAGDATLTRLLLGMGLRKFSMHPSSMLSVKQVVLNTNIAKQEKLVSKILKNEDAEKSAENLKDLNLLNELECG